jgi:hypothetical protein
MSSALHYDHTDDGKAYLGFAHAACNKRAGARKGAATVNRTKPRANPSRMW